MSGFSDMGSHKPRPETIRDSYRVGIRNPRGATLHSKILKAIKTTEFDEVGGKALAVINEVPDKSKAHASRRGLFLQCTAALR